MRVSSCKGKGREFQKEICKLFSKFTGLEWGSFQETKPITWTPMGQSGVDIVLSPKAKKLLPLSIECKRQEKWNLHSWIKQAKDNQEDGTFWALFLRRNRERPIIVMDAEEFILLLEYIKKVKK